MPSRSPARSAYPHWRARLQRFGDTPLNKRVDIVRNRLERRLGRDVLATGPQRLDLIPTRRCNLRCVGCAKYDTDGPADLDLSFFRKILDESAGWVLQYKFCSLGEPFMNPDVPEMLRLAGERGVACHLVTNGTKVDEKLADFIVGRTRTNVLTFSIDGAKAETCERLRRGLKFERLLGGIRAVADAKRRHHAQHLVLQGNFVAMRDNIEELPDLVSLAREVGLEDINVNYLTIEAQTDEANSLLGAPELQRDVFARARERADQTGIALHLPADISDQDYRTRCFFPWDTMIIDTDGSIRLCYFSWDESIGNVHADGGIRAAWNNAIYRAVRATIESTAPFYRYCTHCGRRRGFSRREAHEGRSDGNAHLYEFAWGQPGAPPAAARQV